MRIDALTGRDRPPAANLKRLSSYLLAVTLAMGTVSLTAHLRTVGVLATDPDPGSGSIDEMIMRLGQSQVSFHRSINSPGRAVWPSQELEELAAATETYRLEAGTDYPEELTDAIHRLERLAQLAERALDSGKWVDLQIIMKDFDRSSEELFSYLQEERKRLRLARARAAGAITGTLWITGTLIVLSLIVSVFIAAGLYFNWKKLERSVLGLDP